MLEHSKAFFTRRDPQQEKLLPGYGLLYFDNLYGARLGRLVVLQADRAYAYQAGIKL
jgi:hypothetical protein